MAVGVVEVVLYRKVQSYQRSSTKLRCLELSLEEYVSSLRTLCLNALERYGYSSGQALITTIWLHTVTALEYSLAKVICCFTSSIRYFGSADVTNMSIIFFCNRN